MASSIRIVNLTSGFHVKRSQARGRIEQCLSVWVDKGYTIRDLLPEEQWTARAEQSNRDQETDCHSPLPFAEWPGLMYRPAERDQASHREEMRLTQQANKRYPCECDDCAQKRAAEAKRAEAEATRFMYTAET